MWRWYGAHAHCKHVGAVLHGLVKFHEVGEFTVAETCNQTSDH